MNQPTHRDDLGQARRWLDAARQTIETADASGISAIDYARAAADLGNGYTQLACLEFAERTGALPPRDHGGATSGRDDHAEGVIPGADSGRGTTNAPSPVSSDAKIGTGDLRADLASVVSPAIVGFLDAEIQFVPEARSHALTLTSAGLLTDTVVKALAEAGWRPPLPDGGQDLAEQVAREIRNKLDWHQWPGCDWTNGSLSDVTDVALAAVMPFLEDPPAPRVFFPGDTVPAGVRAVNEYGVILASGHTDLQTMQELLEITVPSPAEWQAAVDQARDEREAAAREPRFPYRQMPHDLCGSNSERQSVGDPGHCEDCCSVGHVVAHPDLGCGDVGCYQTHGDDKPAPERVHAEDCTGCDAPGVVPCDADEARGNLAYRDGMPIKDLVTGTDRFYGFTDDGWPVGTPPEGAPMPDLVARCGGPGMCPNCQADATRLREAAGRG